MLQAHLLCAFPSPVAGTTEDMFFPRWKTLTKMANKISNVKKKEKEKKVPSPKMNCD